MTSKTRIFPVGIFLFLIAYQACAQKVTEVDICVYGGTSAGIITAYTARRLGKSVLIVEPGKHVGGLTTGGLGY
ncbi:MAG TPA: FAD-dependent oxidoreductase, partial [Chryseolinea sp.]|nr:FAD-dependent oxidoreductase [Chryseolinea sp.]